MSVLAEVAAAADAELSEHAASVLPPDRFAGAIGDPDRRFTVEAVHEAYLLHYGEPRAFTGADGDLRLLGGDALYALGLGRVAARGDLEAVAELADLIAAVARAHAEADPAAAAAAWAESARRLA